MSRKGKGFSTAASDGVKTGLAMGIADDWMTAPRFAFILALLVAAAFPGVLLKGQTFTVRDFGMFSYPVAFFHRQAFWKGELPLWNPFNYCGVPFLAQWNTMTLYPGTLIYLLLPLPWSLSLFCLVHLFWGGFGMFFLARRWTGNGLAGALAGIAFSFGGLMLNFVMWPSHIATFSWFPWVLWLVPQAWQRGGRYLFWGVLVGAMQMLAGGPETIVLTWVLLCLLACGDWLNMRSRNKTNAEPDGLPTSPPGLIKTDSESQASRKMIALCFAGVVLLVALVCSAQLMPFLELLAHSERNSGYSAASQDWALPVWGWANFLVPLFHTVSNGQNIYFQIGQYWTSSYYLGIGTVFLAAVAVWRVRDWRVRLLALLGFLCLVLALGDSSPLYRGLRLLFPAIGFVRYPVKFVILVSAVGPLLGAVGFAALLGRAERKVGRFECICVAVLLVLIASIIAFETDAPILKPAWWATCRNGMARAALLSGILFCTMALLRSQGTRRMLCGGIVLALTWLDFVTHVPTQNPSVPPLVYTPDLGRKLLAPEKQPFLGEGRVMLGASAEETFRLNALPDLEKHFLIRRLAAASDCNLLDAVPQMYGFFSLAPGPIANLSNFPYVHTNVDFSRISDFMSVSRVTKPGTLFDWESRPTAMPLVTAGQAPVFAADQTVIDALFQTNTDLRHTVFLPSAAASQVTAKACAQARVLSSKFDNEKVEIRATAPIPTLITVSQSWYPAWRAYIDGKPAPLLRANYAFQAVQVPAGEHDILLRYQDWALTAGQILSFLGLAVWVLLGILTWKNIKARRTV